MSGAQLAKAARTGIVGCEGERLVRVSTPKRVKWSKGLQARDSSIKVVCKYQAALLRGRGPVCSVRMLRGFTVVADHEGRVGTDAPCTATSAPNLHRRLHSSMLPQMNKQLHDMLS